ncbi:sulfite oxidase-like oxidoreductase [Tuwongella immobilis]|uniref:Oxidoreductase molybdopterin-binding domain-containing protein n=1 Tax=Tuwongella immobilis TaxID=692036 RepID=A0A6C2YL66_9BACT|nr:sulfite oxidase-like oxidoreductase [Tuwongella immobilis]VIP02318.1 oxidoreductase : Oxidoreductase, molybdopterin binding OS=Solibacter usitatus (strain Ellin6076) GN=Acid_1522 PE=4 SV=1: Oxidored_molyb [Tuwongella immobilis]VTS01040.1 oxidoreductase : Oxidoreductase, molybdopterin binding OS=Solibacter usitatus (strain Ellin6076) GN=Acid_1522 PE=4 SV=1: Oxidored_molyb [Tuwongella immobilis]
MSDTPNPPAHDDVIVSPDTKRANRIPPYQVRTKKWPVLHAGPTPSYRDLTKWDFQIFPQLLDGPGKKFSWAEFMQLPRVKVFADMHCVTRWSLLDNFWEGVPTRELHKHVTIRPEAKFVMIHCEHGYTTNLPIDDFFDADCLFATHHNGEPLTPDHGYPMRLVVPKLYAWKSAKWVRGIEFMPADKPGFWESWEHGGYHMRGDPWVVDSDHPDGQRFRER